MKSGSFHEKQQFSCEKLQFSYGNLINQLTQHKFFSLMVCWGEAMSQDSMKTTAFHENCRFSHENGTKDHQLPEMVTLMFLLNFHPGCFDSRNYYILLSNWLDEIIKIMRCCSLQGNLIGVWIDTYVFYQSVLQKKTWIWSLCVAKM